MRKFNCFTIVFVLFLLITYPCYAELIPFDSGRWEFKERENKGDMTHAVKKYLGKKCLYLRIGEALVKDLDVTDGIIEYDVAFKEQGKGFLGILWHYLDGENTEHFYVRTHRSGELKATQYTPVINGSNSDVWYRSPAYAQPDVFTYNKWTPIKCILSGDYAELYIEDMDTPLLTFRQQLDSDSGQIGLVSGGFPIPVINGGYFANFRFTPMTKPPIKGKISKDVIPMGTIMRWSVSELIDNDALDGKFRLTEKDQQLRWTELTANKTGFVNFAKVQASGDTSKKSTAFGRTTIISDKEQIKRLQFRYNLQNNIKVYLNGQLLFGSDNQELDTIAKFKDLYLPLQKGTNELCIAITDTPIGGGWGFQTILDDMKGIKIN
jgi:hypothetical protein